MHSQDESNNLVLEWTQEVSLVSRLTFFTPKGVYVPPKHSIIATQNKTVSCLLLKEYVTVLQPSCELFNTIPHEARVSNQVGSTITQHAPQGCDEMKIRKRKKPCAMRLTLSLAQRDTRQEVGRIWVMKSAPRSARSFLRGGIRPLRHALPGANKATCSLCQPPLSFHSHSKVLQDFQTESSKQEKFSHSDGAQMQSQSKKFLKDL